MFLKKSDRMMSHCKRWTNWQAWKASLAMNYQKEVLLERSLFQATDRMVERRQGVTSKWCLTIYLWTGVGSWTLKKKIKYWLKAFRTFRNSEMRLSASLIVLILWEEFHAFSLDSLMTQFLSKGCWMMMEVES